MIPRFDALRPVPSVASISRKFRLSALVCGLVALIGSPAQGAQVLIEPMTTGTYAWDWIGTPVNQSYGFDLLAPQVVGANQKGTITRNYRSYMTFDTLDSQSPILSATLDMTIVRRSIDTLTNPLSALEITLGLPRNYTAEEIANPQYTAQSSNAAGVYADLATNGFATFSIPFGDVILPVQNGDVQVSVQLPLSFVAAFNQARTSSRYLTVSTFGGDYGMFSAEISVQSRLTVNNLTPVPEPLGLSSLAIGVAVFGLRRLRKRQST